MKKLIIGLILVMLLVPVSCAAPSAEHPKGMKSLRWLTDEEKAKVIDIALNTTEAKKAHEKYGAYETNLS